MGTIKFIEKSRKEFICGKCRKPIPKGSPYFRGILQFHPDFIRCNSCGLKWYEVTTSDYIRDVGAIVEDWQESFELQDGVWEEIASNLEEILDSCNERFENIPEQLQEADAGQTLQERIDGLESAIDQLQSCAMEEFLAQGYEELTEEEKEALASEGSTDDFESWYKEFWKKETELAQQWQEKTEEAIVLCIDDILGEVPL